MGKICAFFGHRDTSSKIEPLIEKQIRRLITEKGVDTFWIGGYGWFDIYASGVLRKLKREYPNIHVVLIVAYIQQLHRGGDNFFDSFDYPAEVEAAPYKLAIPVRNRYMVKNAASKIETVFKLGFISAVKRSITVKSKMLLIVSKIKIPLIALLIYLIFTYLDRLS